MPDDVQLIGSEGATRAISRSQYGHLLFFDGPVFMGETVTLSTGMANSDLKLGPNGKWLELPHQVKVTWRVGCGKVTTFDLGQVVTAPSYSYVTENGSASLPHVSMQITITPELCPGVIFPGVGFSAAAIGTIEDSGETPVNLQFASSLSDAETIGCGTGCGTTGFSEPQVVRNGTVNTATGAFSLSSEDLTQTAPGGGWAASRHYSSNNAVSGSLGQGWSLPWETRLSKDPVTGDVTLTSDSGSRHTYTSKGGGSSFDAPSSSRSTLKPLTGGGYSLTTVQNRTLTFDAAGLLTSDKDRSGLGESYTYAGGRVSTITGVGGTIATLQYTGSLLTGAVRSDGNRVAYGYTGGRLTSVTSGGSTTEYGYDTSSRLNSVKDGNGHFSVRSVYDTQGRVVSQTDATGAVTTNAYNGAETDTTMPDGGVWTDIYAHNHLLAQYDPFGNRTDYSYDGYSNLTRVADPLGNAQVSVYNAANRLTSVTAPDGAKQRYGHDSAGNLISLEDARGNTTTFGYDTGQRLTSVKGALGNTAALAYTPVGQLKTATTPLGKVSQYEYDVRGNLTAITAPDGARSTATFNAAGLPLTVTDPRGNASGANPTAFTTTYAYDGGDRVTSVKDPKGATTLSTYDAVGNLKTVTDASGGVTTFAYDAANRLTSTTGPGGGLTSYTYDSMGRTASRTDPTGGKTTYGYDKAGRLISTTTPRGNASGASPTAFTWTYGYDKAGNQTSVKDPAGRITTTAYDKNGRPVSITDPVGNVRTTAYDANGNITRTTDALGAITTYTFDEVTQLTAIKDPNGSTLAYAYDADGNQISETSPLGFKTTYGYDAAGRQVSRTDPRGNTAGADPAQFTWRTGYDAAANPTSETDPFGNKITKLYDAINNLIESSDPQGRKTTYGYDALNRPVQTAAPDGGITKTAYDTAGNVASKADANQHVTAYEYDKNGRRTKATDALNRITQYAYDPDGNRTKVTNARGQTMISSYDSRSLLTSTAYSDGTPQITYTYDNAGQPATLTDGTGTRTFTYDKVGRPLTITAPSSANPFKYTYLADGSVSTRAYPDGRTTSYAYDADGRMTGQTQNGRTTTYGWDQAGNLLTTLVPTAPATTESRTYDQAGRMASITEGAGTRVFSRDGSGRVTTETYKDTTTTGYPKRYDYDAAGRITRACSDIATNVSCLPNTTGERYSYDKVGNRLTATSGASTTTNVYDAADQMTRTTTGSAVTDLTYDDDGNQTKDVAGTYAYDALGHVKSTTLGADTFTFGYDADGNRSTTKKNGTLQRTTQWDVNTSIPRAATDLSATGVLLSDYHYGPLGEPQSLDTSTTSFFYLHDRQNSITAVRDLAGVDTYKYSYGTWGNVIGTAGGGSQQRSSFGYTGTLKDPFITGRSQLPARSYDAKSGRFTTPDPRPGTAQAPNSSTYAYANNDPVNQSDPTGACPLCVSAGIGATIGAVAEGGIYSWQHRNGGFTAWGFTKAAGRGALIGGVAGLLMPGAGSLAARGLGLTGARALATSTAVNAGVGAGFSYAINEYNCRPTGPLDLLVGAAGGAGSSLIGPGLNWLRSLWAPRNTAFALSSPNAFRALRSGEGPGASLVRPGADQSVQPWEHVMQHNNSPWISVTTDPKVMFNYYGKGSVTGWKGSGDYGYISIDLSRVDSEIFDAMRNLPTPDHIRAVFGDDLANTATRHSEMLIKSRLPAEAIVHYWPPGTTLEKILSDIGWR